MLNKKEFQAFRMEVEQALKSIAEKYDANIKAGKIKYDNSSFALELNVHKKEVDGESFEKAEFKKYAFLYGFEPEDYGKTFVSNGKSFTLYGFKPKATKMPVLARSDDGKNYKFGTQVKILITPSNVNVTM